MKHAPQGTFVQKEKVVMSNIQNYVDSGDWERTLKKKMKGGNIFGDMEQNREESWFLSVSHFPQEL